MLQLDALAGLSTNDLPAYDWFRIGGPTLIPGYHMWQLYGPQALAASATLRYRVVGPLRVFLRAGAGNVWAQMGDISSRNLRWGVGGGAMVPTKIGPISAEVGVARRRRTWWRTSRSAGTDPDRARRAALR